MKAWMAFAVLSVLLGAGTVAARGEEKKAPSDEESKAAVAKALAYVDSGQVLVDDIPLTRDGVELEFVNYADAITQDVIVRLWLKNVQLEPAEALPGKPPPRASIELTFDRNGILRSTGVGMPAGMKKEPVIRFKDPNRKPE
jgi:hypothetical protein